MFHATAGANGVGGGASAHSVCFGGGGGSCADASCRSASVDCAAVGTTSAAPGSSAVGPTQGAATTAAVAEGGAALPAVTLVQQPNTAGVNAAVAWRCSAKGATAAAVGATVAAGRRGRYSNC